MRRVPTSWVASGNPNSITDACIHFTQKFVKIRDGEPPGWHILQTFEWGRRRHWRLHEGERKAGHARGDRAESDGFDAWVRARLTSARYSPRRLRGLHVSAVCNDGQTTKSHSGRTRELFEDIFLLLYQFEL